MQINLNPTSERGASRDAVNGPRETLGESHLISSDPRSRFGLVCDLLCCRGNTNRPPSHRAPGGVGGCRLCQPSLFQQGVVGAFAEGFGFLTSDFGVGKSQDLGC